VEGRKWKGGSGVVFACSAMSVGTTNQVDQNDREKENGKRLVWKQSPAGI
jgi:hypothetical protein